MHHQQALRISASADEMKVQVYQQYVPAVGTCNMVGLPVRAHFESGVQTDRSRRTTCAKLHRCTHAG